MNRRIQNDIIRNQFATYVTQSVLAMLGFSCYILADTYFIATGIGAIALAGLNIALPIYNIIFGTGMLLSIGGSTYFAVIKARGDHKTADKIFTFVVVLAILAGALFMVTGHFFAYDLAVLFGGDKETAPIAATYISTVSSFAIPFILNNMIVAFIRNDSSPRFATVSLLAGNLSNVVLDWVFIYPLKMGMFGAALATGTAPIVGICILSTYFFMKKNTFRLYKISSLIFDTGFKNIMWMLKNVVVLGFSSFIIEMAGAIALISFNVAFWSLAGNLGVSAYSIVANIGFVINALFNGIGQGMQPIISRCHGQRDVKGIEQVQRMGLITSLGMAVIIYVILFMCATPIAGIFNKTGDYALNNMAAQGIRYYFFGYFFGGVNIVLAASLNAKEAAGQSLFITMSRGLLMLVPSIYMFAYIGDIMGLWLAQPLVELCTLLCTALYFYIRIRKTTLKSHIDV